MLVVNCENPIPLNLTPSINSTFCNKSIISDRYGGWALKDHSIPYRTSNWERSQDEVDRSFVMITFVEIYDYIEGNIGIINKVSRVFKNLNMVLHFDRINNNLD